MKGGFVLKVSQVQGMDQLINLACGPRSIAEFASSCGISRAHIFRIKNGVTPTRKLCKRIAEDQYVKQLGLTCEEIYKVAGYNDPEDIAEAQQHEMLISNKGNETIDIGIITQRLMGSRYTNQLLPVGANQNADFAFVVRNGRKKVTWKFVVALDDLQDAKSQKRVNAHYYNLGRISSISTEKNEQYTMIVHNGDEFDRLKDMATEALIKGRVSVALVDIDQKEILKETSIGPEKVYLTLSD